MHQYFSQRDEWMNSQLPYPRSHYSLKASVRFRVDNIAGRRGPLICRASIGAGNLMN